MSACAWCRPPWKSTTIRCWPMPACAGGPWRGCATAECARWTWRSCACVRTPASASSPRCWRSAPSSARAMCWWPATMTTSGAARTISPRCATWRGRSASTRTWSSCPGPGSATCGRPRGWSRRRRGTTPACCWTPSISTARPAAWKTCGRSRLRAWATRNSAMSSGRVRRRWTKSFARPARNGVSLAMAGSICWRCCAPCRRTCR